MSNPVITAICPFYDKESKLSVSCESLCDCDLVHTALKFNTPQAKLDWVAQYCASFGYRKCPYAEVLLEKKY